MASSDAPPNPHALLQAQSPDELFEVYHAPADDFDVYASEPRRTGRTKPRRAVHADGDWHRSAHVWIVDVSRQEILAQRRSAGKDTFPNMWDISAAGHVGASTRDSRECATQELAEELGVALARRGAELEFQFTCPAEQRALGGCNCYEDVYFLKWDAEVHGRTFRVGPAEVSDVRWMRVDALRDALERGDPEFVPRVRAYIDAFFPALERFATTSDSTRLDVPRLA